MSDDSIELGGFGPTTPAHPSLRPKPRSRGGQSTSKLSEKANVNVNPTRTGDRHPGPAKRTGGPGGRLAKRKKGAEEEVVVEVLDGGVEEGAGEDRADGEDGGMGEDQEEEARVVASSDGDERQVEGIEAETRVGNGRHRSRVNARGQTKGKQQQRSTKNPIVVYGSDEEENRAEAIHAEAPPVQTKVARNGKSGLGNARVVSGKGKNAGAAKDKAKRDEGAIDLEEVLQGPTGVGALIDRIGKNDPAINGGGSAKQDSKKDAELARLREKVNRLEKENETLSGQMEELFRVRETEAEALMQKSAAQYEAKIRALEEVNQALTTQIARKQPLASAGKSSILHLITREAADEERQALDREIGKLKDNLGDVTKRLASKEKEIEELKQIEKELRFELKAEIDRAASLAKQASRHPQPTPRSGLIAEDPKHREAVKLYEDLTNIIVLNIRSSPGQLKKDEWLFTCCYTHTNESDSVKATTYSISFSLRSYDEEADGEHTDWIQYLPMHLEQEPPDFVEKLGFLNAAFQFQRNQLALFLRTLYTSIEDIVKDGEDDDDGDEEIVEG